MKVINAKRVSTISALIVLGATIGSAQAAVTADLIVNSSTQLTVTLMGTLVGPEPAPSSYPGTIAINLGTSHYTSNIIPATVAGDFSTGYTDGALINNTNTTADTINLFFQALLVAGDSVTGTVTFTYPEAHQISAGQSFNVQWGTSGSGSGVQFQSSGIAVVPETSSSLMVGLATTMIALGRRRKK